MNDEPRWNPEPHDHDAPVWRAQADPRPKPASAPKPAPGYRADLAQKRRRFWGAALRTVLVILVLGTALGAAGAAYVWRKYLAGTPQPPPAAQLFALGRLPGIRFVDATGQTIANRGPKYGDRIALKDLPPYVPRAFLAAEDRRFYSHGAVDLYGVARAVLVNAHAGRVVQGGSTLSQQLAKDLFLTPDQTLRRKLQEALLAYRLEKMLTKDQVLELYLNRIFFGANTYGIDGAARTYFGKPASKLTLGEASLLAALPKAPSRMALNRGMDQAKARAALILAAMLREGWITPEQQQAALAETPKLAPAAPAEDPDFGYVLDYATAEAVRLVGSAAPDLVVNLTIDPDLQKLGGQVVRQAIARSGRRAGASQAALVALAPDGSVRALVGGLDHDKSPFNRAVQARRQPGSTFKPFVYAAALERGVMPWDIRVDGPVRIGDWRPKNYGGGYAGSVTVENALARSINTVAVKLAAEVGGQGVAELARRFGFTSIPPSPDLSIALGTYEVGLLELASGFQVFQDGGQKPTPHMISSIVSIGGQTLWSAPQGATPVYDPLLASRMVRMMKKVVVSGTARRAAFGRPAAGKTGTSQNWRDAWFVGFTPDLLAGVWVGNDNSHPMDRVVGGGLPSEIWRDFMSAALANLPPSDFAWLVPEPPREDAPLQAQAEDEAPRRGGGGVYQGLADDFFTAADELQRRRVPQPAPEDEPHYDDIPY